MTETAPENTNYVNYLKGFPSRVLRLANLTRVFFRGSPPDGTYEKIGERLYPDSPRQAQGFCLLMCCAESWASVSEVHLALELSDVDMIRWLRVQMSRILPDRDDLRPEVILPETQQEALQRVMEEGSIAAGNGNSQELLPKLQSGSSEGSSVHWTGHIAAQDNIGLQRQQGSVLRQRR